MTTRTRFLVLASLSLALSVAACSGGGGEPEDTRPPITAASPGAGTYAEPQSVSLTCSDGDGSGCFATFYTTDGSEPSQASTPYGGPIAVAADTTLRFFSVDNAGNEEAPRLAAYVIEEVVVDTTPPVTSASPAGGTYPEPQQVVLTCTDGAGSGCLATFYTTDGSEPSQASTPYGGPIAVATDTTLRFFSLDNAGNEEAPRTASYVIEEVVVDTTAPLTTASPLGGSYQEAQSVALTCDDGAGSGCAATRFTTDGADPTDASPAYAGPIAVSADTTLKFFSVDQAGNREAVRTEVYQIVPPCQPGADTDGDGLEDCDELAGWNIDLELNGDGQISGANEAQVHVTSDPFRADGDGDGLDDLEELGRRTNPNRADSDQDGLDDHEEAYVYFSSPTDVDSDDDATGPDHDLQPNSGLFDGSEVENHHTSPLMADTDGDDYSDHTEVVGAGRPLVADLPLIEVNIISNLGVFLDARVEAGCEISGQTMQAEFDRDETRSTRKSETSTKKVLDLSGTVHTSASAGFTYIIPSCSASVDVTASVSKSTTRESNASFEKSSVSEHSSEFRRYRSQSCFDNTSVDAGELTATLAIRNAGNRSVYLQNLEIGARRRDLASPGEFYSLASTTLYPTENAISGGSSEEHEVSIRVSATTAMDLLGDPSGLFFSVNDFDIRDEDGRNFAFIEQTTLSRTGMLEIDFGDGRVERYLIATNVERDSGNNPVGVNLRWAMEEILGIPVGTEVNTQGVSALAWVDDEATYKYDASRFRFWYILGNSAALATPGFDFEDLVLQQGDFISLSLLQDLDDDGVFDLEEDYYGTDPLSSDTDRDMIEDRAEIDSPTRHPVVPEFPAGQRVRQTASLAALYTAATLVLLENGTLWTLWGVPVMLQTDLEFAKIFGGGNEGVWMGITTGGDLYAWGANKFGMLGLNSNDPAVRAVPQLVGAACGCWADVSIGGSHVLALRTDGSLWGWGNGDFGALGVTPAPSADCPGAPISACSLVPVQIDAGPWAQIAAGWNHSLGIKQDKSLWGWGRNHLGQVGNGTTLDQAVPVRVGASAAWSKIAAGRYTSMGAQYLGTGFDKDILHVWGDQRFTQFGGGDSDAAYISYAELAPLGGSCTTHANCAGGVRANSRCVGGICYLVTPYISAPHIMGWDITAAGEYVIGLSTNGYTSSETRGDIVRTGSFPNYRWHWEPRSSATWGLSEEGVLGRSGAAIHQCIVLGARTYGCDRFAAEVQDEVANPFAVIDKGRGLSHTQQLDATDDEDPPIGLGELSVWGANDAGQLGLGPTSGEPVTLPVLVPENP